MIGCDCPTLFIDNFNDAAFAILMFALTARPRFLALAVELIFFVLSVVVSLLGLFFAESLFNVWLQS